MLRAIRFLVLILCVICFLPSGLRAGEKKVFLGGTWYTQQPNGSLSVCQECNAGKAIPTVQASAPVEETLAYPCQMIVVRYSSPAKASPCVECETCTGPSCTACPCQTAATVKSDGRFQIGACSSGGCSSGVSGLFSRRPIRSFFGRLFGGRCGG